MRQLLLGLGGAVIFAIGALGAQPAQAQGFAVTIGTGSYGPPVPVYQPYPLYHRPVVYPRPVLSYRYPAYRAYPEPVHYAPRCTTRVTRFWDGFAWVDRRERICR